MLRRAKIDAYISAPEGGTFLSMLIEASVQVEITERVGESTDRKDNKFLELAPCGRADCLVTGDHKHLRKLNTFRGTKIVTARELLDLGS